MGGNQQNSQRDQQPGQVNVSETQKLPRISACRIRPIHLIS
jgi:hypothetical protein